MNCVFISGRFVKDPVVKYSQNNMPWVTFSIAVNAGKDKQAYFPTCKAFDKVAVNIEKWGAKGKMVFIQGHIVTGEYIKDGNKVYTTEVIVDRLEFAEKKSDLVPDEVDKEVQQSIPEGFSKLNEEDIPF